MSFVVVPQTTAVGQPITPARAASEAGVTPLSWPERALLVVGIYEIPLQIDRYYGMLDDHASLGAIAGFHVSITALAFLGLYLKWIFDFATRPRWGSRLPLQLGLPMLLYLVFVGLSFLVAEHRFLALADGANVLQAYLIFFYLANRLQTRTDILVALGAVAACLATQGLLVIGLAAMGDAAVGKEFFIGPIMISVWDDGRPAGTMHSAVLAASVMALFSFPVAGVCLTKFPGLLRFVMMVALVIGLLGILLTQTRGAIATTVLGAGILGPLLLLRGWLSRGVIIVALMACLVGLIPLARVVQKRVLQGDGGSAASRTHLAAIAFDTIADRPLMGHGVGNCHLAMLDAANQAAYREEWFYTVHCKYLLVWVETGLFGLLAFLAVLGRAVLWGWQAWLCRDRLLSVLGLAISIALLGHMVHMLVDIFNSRPQTQSLWVIMGLAAAVARLAIAEATSARVSHHNRGVSSSPMSPAGATT